MQPSGLSSLIFVVIIGVWAAYFIQYWVRRREHLATARSVDQFSEAMRVLERRSPAPTNATASPARASMPVHARRRVEPQPLEAPTAPTLPVAPAARTGASRRARGLTLLSSLVALLLVAPLAALSVLPLPALAVPVLAVAGSFAWVRSSVRAEQQARLAARRAAAQPRRTASAASRPVAAPPAPVVGEPVADGPVSEPEAVVATPVRDELYDVEAVSAPAVPAVPAAAEPQPAAPSRPLVDEDDIPLTWDPVPVPRPTYTMKARVTRPAPASADLVGDADTEYADVLVEDEPVRRAVAGA